MPAHNKARAQDGIDTDFRKVPKLPQHMGEEQGQEEPAHLAQDAAGKCRNSRQQQTEGAGSRIQPPGSSKRSKDMCSSDHVQPGPVAWV